MISLSNRLLKNRLKGSYGVVFVRGFESADVTGDVLKTKKSHTPFKFIDYAQVEVKGGRGGNGCIAFEVMAPGKKKPQGGSGGMGGNVYMIADKRLTGLSFETFHFNASDGKHGGSSNMTGKNGKDVFIRVPCGVQVTEKLRSSSDLWGAWDEYEDEDWDEEAKECEEGEVVGEEEEEATDEEDGDDGLLDEGNLEEWDEDEEEGEPARSVELNTHNQIILLARGGKSGVGNFATKGAGSNTTQKSRKPTVPGQVVKGALGEVKTFLLEVKLIADVGLVGYPNAGKSTLLKAVSNANPKIANYPFTTLHPNIGVIEYSDKDRVTVADIPGLIEGAAENRGLGHEFLRHVERTKVLLYVVDISGTSNKGDGAGSGVAIGGERKVDAVADFLTLRKELELYNPELLEKPAIILANKLDITPRRLISNRLQRIAGRYGIAQVITGSAETGVNMGELAVALRNLIATTNSADATHNE